MRQIQLSVNVCPYALVMQEESKKKVH